MAVYQQYWTLTQEVTLKSGWTSHTVRNPMEQELYISVDDYSGRNFPKSCNHDRRVYTRIFRPSGGKISRDQWLGQYGQFASFGHPGKAQEKGTYKIKFFNKAGAGKKVSITFYSTRKGVSADRKSVV